jgi:hypothetical protein
MSRAFHDHYQSAAAAGTGKAYGSVLHRTRSLRSFMEIVHSLGQQIIACLLGRDSSRRAETPAHEEGSEPRENPKNQEPVMPSHEILGKR